MRITMIGTGYVGLVSGACFSDFGHDVVCVDKDPKKIETLNSGGIPIFEPGLDKLVADSVAAGRLRFTTDLAEGMAGAEAVFIAVGTPTRRGDGHADLRYVFDAAREIAEEMKDYIVIVDKSTVPVGTARKVGDIIAETLEKRGADIPFDVASNPEFLREGSAIEDFSRPDRVVVGTRSARAQEVMKALYRPLFLRETPIVFTNRETAEVIKYAANAFLATKVTFINEIADLCEKVGADVQQVAKGIGLDGRIGSKFLHAGPGYGGSCFPKDTLALVRTAQEAGTPTTIVEAVVVANDKRKAAMAQRIVDACGGSLQNKTIAVLGVTFKPNTDDMRDAPSLDIIPALQKQGANIRAFDPEGMEEAAPLLSNVKWCDGPYHALEGADAVAILTEWNVFRALDLSRVKAELNAPIVVDLRNIYVPEEMAEAGFHYVSIGRPALPPA
ncbi:MAG: UDP-glucose dehydrogenase family protein [Alphaproteobacteria bacterium]